METECKWTELLITNTEVESPLELELSTLPPTDSDSDFECSNYNIYDLIYNHNKQNKLFLYFLNKILKYDKKKLLLKLFFYIINNL